MKKIFFILCSVMLFSCSDDGDNEVDNEKDKINHPQIIASKDYVEYETQYVTNEEASYKNGYLRLSFDFGPEYFNVGDEVFIRYYYGLQFKFLVDINTLKVGDELQTKLEDDTDVKFEEHTVLDYGHENYLKGGKIVVKNIDAKNQKISIEFVQLDIWRIQYYLSGESLHRKDYIIKSGKIDFEYK